MYYSLIFTYSPRFKISLKKGDEMNPNDPHYRKPIEPEMKRDILPETKEGYTIHPIASALRAYLDHKDPGYIVAVRKSGELADGWMVRKVEIMGPSTLSEKKDAPLPGSDGRAVVYIETKGPLKIYWDAIDPETKKAQEKPKAIENKPC